MRKCFPRHHKISTLQSFFSAIFTVSNLWPLPSSNGISFISKCLNHNESNDKWEKVTERDNWPVYLSFFKNIYEYPKTWKRTKVSCPASFFNRENFHAKIKWVVLANHNDNKQQAETDMFGLFWKHCVTSCYFCRKISFKFTSRQVQGKRLLFTQKHVLYSFAHVRLRLVVRIHCMTWSWIVFKAVLINAWVFTGTQIMILLFTLKCGNSFEQKKN